MTPSIPGLTYGQARRAFAPMPFYRGVSSLALPKWRRARARVRAGAADAHILCIGDSTTAGVGVSDIVTQGSLQSYPYALASIMNASGLPAAAGMGVPYAPSNPDPRWVSGSGWALYALGWADVTAQRGAAGAAGALTFTPGVAADTYDIWYVRTSSTGTLTAVATGGSAVATATANATPAIGKATVAAGSISTANVITMTVGATGDVFVLGIEPRRSDKKQVLIANAGVGSSRTVTQWAGDAGGSAGSAASSRGCIRSYAPDLTIISLGLNDASDGTSVATWLAAMETVIAVAAESGDVIVMSPIPPASNANANRLTFVPQYVAAVRSMAHPIVILDDRWGPTASNLASTNGMMTDSVHPNAVGYADIADGLWQALRSV